MRSIAKIKGISLFYKRRFSVKQQLEKVLLTSGAPQPQKNL